jgi:hypothetical protein
VTKIIEKLKSFGSAICWRDENATKNATEFKLVDYRVTVANHRSFSSFIIRRSIARVTLVEQRLNLWNSLNVVESLRAVECFQFVEETVEELFRVVDNTVARVPVNQQIRLIDRCGQCGRLVQLEQQVDQVEQRDLRPPNFAVHGQRDEHVTGTQPVGDRAELVGRRVQEEHEIGEEEEHTEVGFG